MRCRPIDSQRVSQSLLHRGFMPPQYRVAPRGMTPPLLGTSDCATSRVRDLKGQRPQGHHNAGWPERRATSPVLTPQLSVGTRQPSPDRLTPTPQKEGTGRSPSGTPPLRLVVTCPFSVLRRRTSYLAAFAAENAEAAENYCISASSAPSAVNHGQSSVLSPPLIASSSRCTMYVVPCTLYFAPRTLYLARCTRLTDT